MERTTFGCYSGLSSVEGVCSKFPNDNANFQKFKPVVSPRCPPPSTSPYSLSCANTGVTFDTMNLFSRLPQVRPRPHFRPHLSRSDSSQNRVGPPKLSPGSTRAPLTTLSAHPMLRLRLRVRCWVHSTPLLLQCLDTSLLHDLALSHRTRASKTLCSLLPRYLSTTPFMRRRHCVGDEHFYHRWRGKLHGKCTSRFVLTGCGSVMLISYRAAASLLRSAFCGKILGGVKI